MTESPNQSEEAAQKAQLTHVDGQPVPQNKLDVQATLTRLTQLSYTGMKNPEQVKLVLELAKGGDDVRSTLESLKIHQMSSKFIQPEGITQETVDCVKMLATEIKSVAPIMHELKSEGQQTYELEPTHVDAILELALIPHCARAIGELAKYQVFLHDLTRDSAHNLSIIGAVAELQEGLFGTTADILMKELGAIYHTDAVKDAVVEQQVKYTVELARMGPEKVGAAVSILGSSGYKLAADETNTDGGKPRSPQPKDDYTGIIRAYDMGTIKSMMEAVEVPSEESSDESSDENPE